EYGIHGLAYILFSTGSTVAPRSQATNPPITTTRKDADCASVISKKGRRLTSSMNCVAIHKPTPPWKKVISIAGMKVSRRAKVIVLLFQARRRFNKSMMVFMIFMVNTSGAECPTDQQSRMAVY